MTWEEFVDSLSVGDKVIVGEEKVETVVDEVSSKYLTTQDFATDCVKRLVSHWNYFDYNVGLISKAPKEERSSKPQHIQLGTKVILEDGTVGVLKGPAPSPKPPQMPEGSELLFCAVEGDVAAVVIRNATLRVGHIDFDIPNYFWPEFEAVREALVSGWRP